MQHKFSLTKIIASISLFLAGILSLAQYPTPARAQAQPLDMQVTPLVGTPGTTITIEGQGAPPNHRIQVSYASYEMMDICQAGRGADGVLEATSDANGHFSLTHEVPQPIDEDTMGFSYRAEIAPNDGYSNYACFIFPSTQHTFPETGHQIRGRFLSYWYLNGGLDVFGYPLTAERTEEGRTVQYFERTRFEYAPENKPPYDVLLGRIGVEVMQMEGIDWSEMPTGDGPAEGCLYFEQTDHNLCNQLGDAGIGFLNYWRSNGLEFDGQPGSSHQESLALFGLPVTEPYASEVEGKEVQVQWFERARFEWHADNPAGSQVLLGRLGTHVAGDVAVHPEQPPQPPEVNQVQLYFIALGDQGQSGPEVGCGDSVVGVTVDIEPTTAPLTAAFERLLAMDEEYYGQSGLYNALAESDLSLDGATVENGQARIYLTGAVRIGGTCEGPRVAAQIRQTADQFSTVEESIVYINGERLEDIVSLRD